ncbi:hypothetical protein TA3x_004860 [Tundrisphaera sp. TA3]|uniref:hypothetical protein n=1 Tax=Tundrisphaera sp. TA3 TaxID=3435775 RepID=UPI003EB941B6
MPNPRAGGESALMADRGAAPAPSPGAIIVTEVSPFHCLYQDALEFHKQSRLALKQSESAASRFARASLLLYVASAEALIHQAAAELGRADLAAVVADPMRPLPLADVSKLLPGILGAPKACDHDTPPWPQFAELLALRATWSHPGEASARRAYYVQSRPDADFEPLQPHQIPPGSGLRPDALMFPRTGLPRDPYAIRPRHLDTVRSVLDNAVEALDRRLDGALTRDNRHRREPTRRVPANAPLHQS